MLPLFLLDWMFLSQFKKTLMLFWVAQNYMPTVRIRQWEKYFVQHVWENNENSSPHFHYNTLYKVLPHVYFMTSRIPVRFSKQYEILLQIMASKKTVVLPFYVIIAFVLLQVAILAAGVAILFILLEKQSDASGNARAASQGKNNKTSNDSTLVLFCVVLRCIFSKCASFVHNQEVSEYFYTVIFGEVHVFPLLRSLCLMEWWLFKTYFAANLTNYITAWYKWYATLTGPDWLNLKNILFSENNSSIPYRICLFHFRMNLSSKCFIKKIVVYDFGLSKQHTGCLWHLYYTNLYDWKCCLILSSGAQHLGRKVWIIIFNSSEIYDNTAVWGTRFSNYLACFEARKLLIQRFTETVTIFLSL